MTPDGLRGEKRSVAAMKAPKTQATVVKKPKTFWMRLKELYMVGDKAAGMQPRPGEVVQPVSVCVNREDWRVGGR